MKYIQVDPTLRFTDMPEDELYSLWKSWYPGGSGPLGAMRTICQLIESVAYLRGIDTSSWYEKQK